MDWPDGFDVPDEFLERMPWLETPLDLKKPQIRVLKLHKGLEHEPIVCDMRVVSLDDQPEYETMSYVWGDRKNTKLITVGGEKFEVTENLDQFLRCLRLENADRTLWADAICIDQRNAREKLQQIGLMRRVFRDGREAHIWFGHFTSSWQEALVEYGLVPESQRTLDWWSEVERRQNAHLPQYLRAGGKLRRQGEHSYSKGDGHSSVLLQAISVLEELGKSYHFHDFPLFELPDDYKDDDGDEVHFAVLNKHWATVIQCVRWLLSRPWWSRIWTLQEAVIPRVDPLIHVGSISFHLRNLLAGVRWVNRQKIACCKLINNVWMCYYAGGPKGIFDRTGLVVSCCKSFPKGGEFGKNCLDIRVAIKSAQSRKATELRDHFFGILGVLPEVWQPYFVDLGYSVTAAEIFGQCTKLLFVSTKDLTMLSESVGLKKAAYPGLPTWAFDLTAGHPDTVDGWNLWKLFDASQGVPFSPQFDVKSGGKSMNQLQGMSLEVQAVYIGQVGECATRASLGGYMTGKAVPQTLNLVKEWRYLYARSVHNPDYYSFWRAAFRDRNVKQYFRHPREPLRDRSLDEIERWWANFSDTANHCDLDSQQQNVAIQRRSTYYFRALEWTVKRGRFFITKDGEPGTGPHDVEQGDPIYVLAGCATPLVLRPKVQEREQGFQLVGPCMLDGWMYGEALRSKTTWAMIKLF